MEHHITLDCSKLQVVHTCRVTLCLTGRTLTTTSGRHRGTRTFCVRSHMVVLHKYSCLQLLPLLSHVLPGALCLQRGRCGWCGQLPCQWWWVGASGVQEHQRVTLGQGGDRKGKGWPVKPQLLSSNGIKHSLPRAAEAFKYCSALIQQSTQ